MQIRPLPPNYAWLEAEPGPRMLREALALHGVLEAKGAANSPQIMQWAQEVARAPGCRWIGSWYDRDEIPWCGLFLGVVALRAGKPVRPTLLSARDWLNWGTPVAGAPKLGDVLVFARGSGGHVALYVGEDEGHFHILGGNQGDRVSIMRIERSRLLGARNHYTVAQPANCRRVVMSPSGPVSTDES